MVISCSAYGCTNRQAPKDASYKQKQFHRNEIKKNNFNTMILRTTSEYLSDNGIKFEHPIGNEIGCEYLHETQMTKKNY